MKTGEMLDFATQKQQFFEAGTDRAARKERGHFGTPPEIAKFMAEMFDEQTGKSIRLLDAGAGVGTLSVALCQRLVEQGSNQTLHIELWENDPQLVPIRREAVSQSLLVAVASSPFFFRMQLAFSAKHIRGPRQPRRFRHRRRCGQARRCR
ncbi:MAG: hypothetical protein R3C03_17760 [Pirellulaceae bacterium]